MEMPLMDDGDEKQRRVMVAILEAQNTRIRHLEADLEFSRQELHRLRSSSNSNNNNNNSVSPILSSAAFESLRLEDPFRYTVADIQRRQQSQPQARAERQASSQPPGTAPPAQNPSQASKQTHILPAVDLAPSETELVMSRAHSTGAQRANPRVASPHGLGERAMSDPKKLRSSRYWAPDEHERFLAASQKFGVRAYTKIAAYVGTRTPKQVRTHAQKFRLRLMRESGGASRGAPGGGSRAGGRGAGMEVHKDSIQSESFESSGSGREQFGPPSHTFTEPGSLVDQKDEDTDGCECSVKVNPLPEFGKQGAQEFVGAVENDAVHSLGASADGGAAGGGDGAHEGSSSSIFLDGMWDAGENVHGSVVDTEWDHVDSGPCDMENEWLVG